MSNSFKQTQQVLKLNHTICHLEALDDDPSICFPWEDELSRFVFMLTLSLASLYFPLLCLILQRKSELKGQHRRNELTD